MFLALPGQTDANNRQISLSSVDWCSQNALGGTPRVTIAKEGLLQSMNPDYYKAIIIEKLNEQKVITSSLSYSLVCPITQLKLGWFLVFPGQSESTN